MAQSKTSKGWLKEHFDDEYVRRSQEDGLRSRASYKLLEIQEKDKLIKRGMTVVDLGAAPGGWSQVAANLVGDTGRVVASDILPIDPRIGLYAAVTRKGMSGEVYGPDERISIQEAIRGYTASGAWLTFEEEIKGTLEPGMLADLVVLSENILETDPERILQVDVDLTAVEGVILYERPNAR